MKDERKAREQLINELAEMRQRMAELEPSEVKRKQAEEALRESEREKAIILNSLSELVTYQDRELRIKWANRAAGESVASSPEQLVGRHCYEVWQERSEPCEGCPVVKALETSQPQQGEMTTPDGRVWFTRGYPVRDKHGDVVGAVEVTLEITKRKRAEQALRRRAEELGALQATVLDPGGGRQRAHAAGAGG